MASRTMWGPVTVSDVDPTDPVLWGFGAPTSSALSPFSTITAAAGTATTAVSANSPLHPDHPMFWVAALIAVTFGAVGFSAHARVGPARGGVDVGNT